MRSAAHAVVVPAVLGVLLASAGARSLPSCPRCNVVFVTFDALRADRLGAYGYPKPTSPAADALARRSTVFRNCVSQSATTVASVPSIMTSKFAVADRLLDGLVLRPDQPTIATVLRAAGYHTLAVISHQYARCAYSRCQGFEVTDDGFPVPESASQTAERVLRLLEAKPEEPFFLWVHLRQPHAPYDVDPKDFAAMYGPAEGSITSFSPEVQSLGFWKGVERLLQHYRDAGEPVERMRLVDDREHDVTPTVVWQLQALYDANVRAGDAAFGRIVDDLERRGLLGRTAVVLAADHGEALGEHGWFGHNRLWQSMLHTPLVVYVPGVPHRSVAEPVMNVDVFPTLVRLVGVPLKTPVRGTDLLGSRDPDYVQYAERTDTYVVIRGGWKARASSRAPQPGGVGSGSRAATDSNPTGTALWNVARDPAEAKDLSMERSEVASRLTAAGEKLRRRSLATDPGAPVDDLLERLRALGYIAPDAPREE